MASYLHHTATTIYPCCVPALGDLTGAGCVGLAGANIKNNAACANIFKPNFELLPKLPKRQRRPLKSIHELKTLIQACGKFFI